MNQNIYTNSTTRQTVMQQLKELFTGPSTFIIAVLAISLFIGWFFLGINSTIKGYLSENQVFHMEVSLKEGYVTIDYADDLANKIADEIFIAITKHHEMKKIIVSIVNSNATSKNGKPKIITKINIATKKLRGMHNINQFEAIDFVRVDLLKLLKKGDKEHHLYFHNESDGK